MCIIILSPSGADMPTDKVLDICWDNNPDGAGFMYLRPGDEKVHMRKGFMTLESLTEAIKAEAFKKEDIVAVHFRISTCLGVNASQTHPFPVVDQKKALFKLDYRSKTCMMHNGVLGKGTGTLTDTQKYVKDTLLHIPAYDTEGINTVARDTVGSRILILDAEYGIIMTGSWVEDGGLYFSNSTYLYSTASYYDTWTYGTGYDWKGEPYIHGGHLTRKQRKQQRKYYHDVFRTYAEDQEVEESVGVEKGKAVPEAAWNDVLYDTKGCGYGRPESDTTACGECWYRKYCDRLEDQYAEDWYNGWSGNRALRDETGALQPAQPLCPVGYTVEYIQRPEKYFLCTGCRKFDGCPVRKA